MIQLALIVVASIAVVALAVGVTLWYWQREPAGHGQHANPDRERRTVAEWWRTFQAGRDAPAPQTVTLTRRDLPCEQPDPRWALEVHHHDLPGPAQVRPPVLDGTATLLEPGAKIDGRAGEPHHRDWTPRPLAAARDGLAPWIEAALANARPDDTVTSTATLEPYVRLMLTCPIEYLDDAIRADKMTLALAGAR